MLEATPAVDCPRSADYNEAVMLVTITGGTGLIGRALARRLRELGHDVVVTGRRAPAATTQGIPFVAWDATGPLPHEALRGAGAIVHLVGETVAQRWTREAKVRIRASRIESTRRLVESLSASDAKPAVLVSASAVGIYGDRGDEWLTETSPPGAGFLAELAREWEQAALGARELGVRVVVVRIGVVLDGRGGALARMLPPFRLGLGATLGSGRQWMSWIHIADLLGLIVRAIEDERLAGAVNAVAPAPVTNREFTRALARALGRPAFLRVPAPMLRLVLGEMAEILLASQRVEPRAALEAGFEFRFPDLAPALTDLLGRRRG